MLNLRTQTHRAETMEATTEVAQRHPHADPALRVLHLRNEGVAAARNVGSRQARSDLLAR